MTYDLLIIGGGPGGTAGAVYAARKQLNTIIVAEKFGGQSDVSAEIYNWIGTKAISGADLAKAFEEHVYQYEGQFLTIKKGQKVTALTSTLLPLLKGGSEARVFTATLSNGEKIEAKTVLVASGSRRRKLDVPGADKFENKGVVYCASCDGPLFSGMDVVVIGGGNAGFESAAQLLAYCKSVTLMHRRDTYKADEITVRRVLAHEKMKELKNTEPLEVLGDKFVTGIKYKNTVTGEEGTLPVGGIFVEVGQIPNTDFLKELLPLDEIGRVLVDPRSQATSLPGIWAAGDCTDILYHQNNIAAGDAVRALEDIYLWIHAR